MADTHETDELVERLRGFEGSDDLGNGDFSVCREAADRLASLEERERVLVEAAFREGFGVGVVCGLNIDEAEQLPMLEGKVLDRAWQRSGARTALSAGVRQNEE